MSHNLGADELRIRGSLRRLIDGPAATPPPTPPGPPPDEYKPAPATRRAAPRLPNWWDRKPTDLTADKDNEEPEEAQPEPAEEPADTEPEPARRPPKRRTTRPAYRDDQHRSPRQSLLDAWGTVPRRVRWLIYHATAATAGWRLGWIDWGTDTAAWYAAGHWVSPSAFALYGLGACLCALYRRSRTWAWLIAWAAAVPVSSVVVGVLLYGTGYQP